MNQSYRLRMETRAAQQLRDDLRTITDDAEAIRDTVDGETNLKDAIHAVLKAMDEDAMLLTGIKQYKQTLDDRMDKIEWRQEKRREAILKAMQAGEIQKVIYPEGTISLKVVPPALEITDEAAIPPQYLIPQDPKIDKAALKEALKDGKTVSGAMMNNGGMTISIRRG